MSTHLYDLAEGPTDRVRRNYAAPSDTLGAADPDDARTLVRHLLAQRKDDARRSGFLGAAAFGATAAIGSHHDAYGNVR